MIDIYVQRGEGLNPGADITDPLLSALAPALSRGRAELDSQASGIQGTTLEITHRAGLRMGKLIEVHDALLGRSWRGKIAGITYKGAGGALTAELRIERPMDFGGD